MCHNLIGVPAWTCLVPIKVCTVKGVANGMQNSVDQEIYICGMCIVVISVCRKIMLSGVLSLPV